jgi:hypothetical protein
MKTIKSASTFFVVVLSLCLCAFGQTNESAKARLARETSRRATWGLSTNGIRFGVRVAATGPSEADKFKAWTFLYDTTSSNIFGLWRLPHGYRFKKLVLNGPDGEEIEKTAIGNALCKLPVWDLSDGRVVVLESEVPYYFDEVLDLRDCFEIRKPGAYTLTVKARLYALEAYREYSELDVPEARVAFVIGESDVER